MNGKVTAFGFRHSLTDAARELTPEGYTLAINQGKQLKIFLGWNSIKMLGKTKHLRTGQSLAALIAPYGELPDAVHCDVTDVDDLCSDAITAAHDATPKGLMAKIGKFRAMMQVHGQEKMKELAKEAIGGVEKMLYYLNIENTDVNETAIFVTHSPGLELATWAVMGFTELPDELATLHEMDGIEFVMDEDYNIKVLCKLCAPRL